MAALFDALLSVNVLPWTLTSSEPLAASAPPTSGPSSGARLCSKVESITCSTPLRTKIAAPLPSTSVPCEQGACAAGKEVPVERPFCNAKPLQRDRHAAGPVVRVAEAEDADGAAAVERDHPAAVDDGVARGGDHDGLREQ